MREETFGLNQSREKGLPFSFPCHWLIASLFLSTCSFLHAQNLKCKTIPTNTPVKLDTVLIEPGSITFAGEFEWNDSTQVIQISSQQAEVEVCYRVLSPLLTKTYQNRDIADYDDSREIAIISTQNPGVEKEELFDFGGVQKYGAITRGVSFGNRQSLFVNSSLNLQMDGKLDENLFLSAVITDQNVPYQPEGNTQQIRDFDNVFIKLYNDRFDVTAGDVVLQQPDDAGYFLRYYKNVQGLQASYRGQSGKWKHESRVSGALSKGKFNSAVLEPIDGLNGPYKLRGPNGERFIIVLANSEKVFLDGKRLERGFDRDYVIDYNLGEITFNNHIVITQFSIIRVDFEYAEQFYSRTNLSAYQSVSNEKVRLYANYYRERDNPNTSFGFSLNETDLDQLRSIGDNIDQAFVTGFDSVRFSENRILYIKKDTVDQDGNPQEIFQYSTDPSVELFSPTFSDVGFGNGNYILRETTANGRVYEWVSPQSGEAQGNYEPGAFIPLPNSRQMITLGGEVQLSEYESVKSEVAFSNTDQNLYSPVDDNDNTSRGYFTSIQTSGRSAPLSGYNWVGSLAMELDEKDFTFIDRYRSILFDRDWNYTSDRNEQSQDLILFARAGIEKNNENRFIMSANRRKRADFIDGWQYTLDFNQEVADVRLVSTHFLLENQQVNRTTDWVRSKSDLSYRKWKIAPGYQFDMDENEIQLGDSVVSSLMHYRAHEVYLTSTDSSKSNYRIGYQLRNDKRPVNGSMVDYLFSKNLRASYSRNGEKGSVTADFNYRQVEDKLELNLGQDEVINGRVNWAQNFLNRNLRSNFSYSTGNSRELRREFVYLPVATGEGTHTWRDTNGDGVQDLNEFFEAINPDERNYVKIFTPTDDYITSFQTFYLHTIDARFPVKWRSHGGLKQFASKLSANVNFNVNYKTTSESYSDRLNPFTVDLSDENLVSTQNVKRYTLFYNRNGRGFAGDFTHQTSDNKQLLVQGFETREKWEWISNAKVDLGSEYTFRVTTSLGNLLNQSDYLDSRNFEIITYTYSPQLIWQPSNVLRLIGSYERKTRRNEFTESSLESALSKVYKTELTWNQAGKGSLRGTFSIVQIDFTGDPSSYLGYLLLDALQPGTNQTWQLNWQQKISKGMQLSLLYNGRKSEDASAIHTGNVQVTAFF
ncbi:hypothetical protein [Ekhidna sp.]|jgi:hypothetical protein|uniref:hypothetical protein n=1 Tax=Ekhidna sp. TaxID=2608089 RepID=UPI0032F0851D